MPSTFDDLLRLELQANGENVGTWGTKANTNLTLLARAIAGHETVGIGGTGDIELTLAEGSDDQAREMFLTLTGTLTGNRNVIIPPSSKIYVVRRNTTGSFTVTIKTAAGTGVALPAGETTVVACDGTDTYGISSSTSVAKAGDTMTGNLVITTVSPGVVLNRTVGTGQAYLESQVGGLTRWRLAIGTSATESGSNAGSNLSLERFSDAGASLGNVFTIDRASGVITLNAATSVDGNLSTRRFIFMRKTTSADAVQLTGRNEANLDRWRITMPSAATETGGNAGSNFAIGRHDDSGALIDNPFIILRDTGKVTASGLAAQATTSATTAGLWQVIDTASGAAAVLPSGATHAYMIMLINAASGICEGVAASVAAGGTTVGAATSGRLWRGFSWRQPT